METFSIAVVGASSAGLALALAARRRGVAVRGIWNRGEAGRKRAADLFPEVHVAPLAAGTHTEADLVVVAVADAAIAEVAAGLHNVPGALAHLSGALPSVILGRPQVVSMHPMLAITDPVRGADALAGAYFAVEGEPESCSKAAALIQLVGAKPVTIAAADKARYHAAAVLASNLLVATLASAQHLVPDALAPGLARLAVSAMGNADRDGVTRALTGPVLRGDVATVRAHLEALSNPTARAIYIAATSQAVELAISRGLAPDKAQELDALLRA
jgi:predicted short-subunit dehydrogenase-like oxidoreductase (DUF2520 family)